MLIIGLTGGIATGKSTVSKYFREGGIPVIDADQIAREILQPGERPYRKVVEHFGREILQPDGVQIDRQKLGAIIFNDPEKRRALNGITHPAVRRRMLTQILKYYISGYRACVLDVPLLIESRLDKYCSKIVVVDCDRDTQVQRLMARDGISYENAQSRINAQLPMEEKKRYATRVIDNNEDKTRTAQQVEEVIKNWMPSQFSTWGLLVAPVAIIAGAASLWVAGKNLFGGWTLSVGSSWLAASLFIN
ncbi:Dephospho-CoA kinase [Spiromyces aspiralis]|uniref:Dephospho-CoA kinase n=1 Tax=Spiromyces aspiralis TaxID=68401 RepID=A0ACC1HD08_9FUNG|nr:Dephospho-CoA kinase [Spiromyces aspiralis]